jgi:hypothetical protein
MPTTYDNDDYLIITSNVFLLLCQQKEKWQDIRSVAKNIGCFNNSKDVADIA